MNVPYATQNAFPGPNHRMKPNPSPSHESAQSQDVFSVGQGYAHPEGGEPLPMTLQAEEASESVEELATNLPTILRPGLKAYEEATPRSSLGSERSREFWEEDSQGDGVAGASIGQLEKSSRREESSLPALGPVQHFIPKNTQNSDSSLLKKQSQPTTSRNPFRRGNSGSGLIRNSGDPSDSNIFSQSPMNQSVDNSDPGKIILEVSFCAMVCADWSVTELPIEMTANLSLADRPFSEYSTSYRPSTLDLFGEFDKQEPEQRPPVPQSSRPLGNSISRAPVTSRERNIDDHQPPLIPVSVEHTEEPDTGALRSDLPSALRGSGGSHIATKENLRSPIIPDLQKELPATPPTDTLRSVEDYKSVADREVVFGEEPTSTLGTASQETARKDHPPPMPPRPIASSSRTAEADLLRLKEQRNETYQIKHFNWFDHSTKTLRRSSMLTQNKNGPCPLLALVNALILSGENDSRSALGAALRTREQVSLGLLIESLMDDLTSEGRRGELKELPDVDELNRFLLMLHTGMNANPRLAPPVTPSANLMDARSSTLHLPILNNDRNPGTFEDTQDMRLYGAFGIPLVHGWLAPWSDPARDAFTRSAQTYEDAQTIQFREEELYEKLSSVGLATEEQQLLQDISSIKSFLESFPTQITPHGLDVISESLFPGAFAILFRNDHFSTIYKHPESGQLFTLVTDAGYSDKDEVIWESLVDVSGQESEFFSGDFRPVGNVEANNELHRTRPDDGSARARVQRPTRSVALGSPTSLLDQQQQNDADFAMALQLQEEEEARIEDARRRSRTSDTAQRRNSGMNNSHRPREDEANRPTIPPRSGRNHGVNRPIDSNSDEAPPPAYEEAAKGKPYLPPLGHPQHPSFDARSPASGPSTPLTPMHPPGPRSGQVHSRRMSAFQENAQYQNSAPLTRPRTNNSVGVAQGSERARDRDKDCTVM